MQRFLRFLAFWVEYFHGNVRQILRQRESEIQFSAILWTVFDFYSRLFLLTEYIVIVWVGKYRFVCLSVCRCVCICVCPSVRLCVCVFVSLRLYAETALPISLKLRKFDFLEMSRYVQLCLSSLA